MKHPAQLLPFPDLSGEDGRDVGLQQWEQMTSGRWPRTGQSIILGCLGEQCGMAAQDALHQGEGELPAGRVYGRGHHVLCGPRGRTRIDNGLAGFVSKKGRGFH